VAFPFWTSSKKEKQAFRASLTLIPKPQTERLLSFLLHKKLACELKALQSLPQKLSRHNQKCKV